MDYESIISGYEPEARVFAISFFSFVERPLQRKEPKIGKNVKIKTVET